MTSSRKHIQPRSWRWGWILAGGLLGLFTSVLAFAPAHWLALALSTASGDRLRLHATQGSIWHGSARLTLSGGAGSADAMHLPGRMHWVIRLGLGGVQLHLHADCCMPSPLAMELRWGWRRSELTMGTLRASLPAQLLAGLGSPWTSVRPQGLLTLDSPGLALQIGTEHWSLQGRLRLLVRDFTSDLATLRPLGSYQLELSGGAQPVLRLETLRGPLRLSGQGSWTGMHLHFEGMASATPP